MKGADCRLGTGAGTWVVVGVWGMGGGGHRELCGKG